MKCIPCISTQEPRNTHKSTWYLLTFHCPLKHSFLKQNIAASCQISTNKMRRLKKKNERKCDRSVSVRGGRGKQRMFALFLFSIIIYNTCHSSFIWHNLHLCPMPSHVLKYTVIYKVYRYYGEEHVKACSLRLFDLCDMFDIWLIKTWFLKALKRSMKCIPCISTPEPRNTHKSTWYLLTFDCPLKHSFLKICELLLMHTHNSNKSSIINFPLSN